MKIDLLLTVKKIKAKLIYTDVLIAKVKNFKVPHPSPSKEGMWLVHSCLEGPEVGVYVRGSLKNKTEIKLPDYWVDLVHNDSITVQLQPVGCHQDLIAGGVQISLLQKDSVVHQKVSDEGLWHETIPQDVSFNLDDMAYILYKTTKTWTGHFADGTDISKLTLSSSIGILPQYYHIASTTFSVGSWYHNGVLYSNLIGSVVGSVNVQGWKRFDICRAPAGALQISFCRRD